MTVNSENQRFRNLIKQYRRHFKLSQEDIAEFLGIKQNAYSAMETGRGNIDLDKVDSIAKIYGLRHFQLLQPNQKPPKVNDLPTETRKKVLARQAEGKNPRNDSLALPSRVMEVLLSGSLSKEFTSSEVWTQLQETTRSQIKPVRITDLFNKGELKEKVVDSGKKRGREKLYRLR